MKHRFPFSEISQSKIVPIEAANMAKKVSKFVAYSEAAKPLLAKVLGADKLDAGFIAIGAAIDAARFIQECRKLRFWERTGV